MEKRWKESLNKIWCEEKYHAADDYDDLPGNERVGATRCVSIVALWCVTKEVSASWTYSYAVCLCWDMIHHDVVYIPHSAWVWLLFQKMFHLCWHFYSFFHMRVELCVNTHIRANIIALDAARRLSQLVYYMLSGWRAISDPSEKSLNSREPVDVSQSSTTTQHIATLDEKSYVNVD